MIEKIDEYISDGGRVFIGTDSQIQGDICVFATAICLHDMKGKRYSKYFFRKSREKTKLFKILRSRIMKEVQNSLDVYMLLLERYPDVDIEIHVDIGRTSRSATRVFVDTVTGWLKGVGVDCKIKPDSWASSSMADRHTK
jgi:predicted RNase H-related nuclease YkuK (DUF458 family)